MYLHRGIAPPDVRALMCQHGIELGGVNFSGALILREVIAGARFPMSKKPIEDALKGYSEDVKIVKATQSIERFEIIVNERGFEKLGSV
jgi:hypothetical protein